jgi:hypothetical protein
MRAAICCTVSQARWPLAQAGDGTPEARFDRHEYAVQYDHVKVDVQVQRRAEALDQRHRAGVACRTGETRVLQQPARDRAVDRAQYQRQRIRIPRQQIAQRKGQRQHPLSQGSLRQHLIGQQCRRLCHAPSTARGAKPALLAAERQQLFGVAVPAAHPQEPFLQSAALQIRVELFLHVAG